MEKHAELDLSHLPYELKLLIKIISLDSHEQLKQEDVRGINWDAFIELAIHHRIYPLLFSKLKNQQADLIPNAVIHIIQNICQRNTMQMLHLCSEMEQMNQLCIKGKIPLLILKGPVLAKELYGDVSLRTSSDLDILVPIHQIEEMEKLLLDEGYVKDEYIESILGDWKWRHHHFTYIHPIKAVKVEVHWRLNPGPGKEPSFNDLWERRRVSNLTKGPLYYLGGEDLFLFLVSHGARHGWSRLRWLFDIHQLLKSDLDWKKVEDILKKHHYLHHGGQAVFLACELLNSKKTPEMQFLVGGKRSKKLAGEAMFYIERQVNLHTDPVPDDVSTYHKKHLFSLMSVHQKAYYFLSILHPFPTDAKVLPLPKKLHFLYYPLRPFLWILRKRKNRKQVMQ